MDADGFSQRDRASRPAFFHSTKRNASVRYVETVRSIGQSVFTANSLAVDQPYGYLGGGYRNASGTLAGMVRVL